MSPHTVTGHFTGCTFHSSMRIDLACSHSAFTSASGKGLHCIKCSICRSRSDCDAIVFASWISFFWLFEIKELRSWSPSEGLSLEDRETEMWKAENGYQNSESGLFFSFVGGPWFFVYLCYCLKYRMSVWVFRQTCPCQIGNTSLGLFLVLYFFFN